MTSTKQSVDDITKKQKDLDELQKKPEMIKFSLFFRYLDLKNKLILTLGTVSAVCCGCLLPSLSIMLGEVTNTFDPDNSADEILDTMSRIAWMISIVGAGVWILGYLYYSFWQHLAENISFDLRTRYLNAILKQEVAYFEKVNVEQLPTQIADYFFVVTDSIGEKFSNVIFSFSTFFSGVGIAFYRGADFAACCVAFFPIIFLMLVFFSIAVKRSTFAKVAVQKKLGGVIEESLTAIKLIASFANEEKEIKKFEKLADEVRVVAHKQEFWLSMFIAYFRLFIFGFYVYSFYIATIYIENGRTNPSNEYKVYTTGELMSVFVALMSGMMMIFSVTPQLEALVKAKVVGRQIFDVIDRVPEIKDHSECVNEFNLTEHIRFEGITFKYPTAPENSRNVLERVNFLIKAGETTAIVGPSGSGKSTIIQMIERFYQPKEGNIYFDNTNITDIKLKALRESIGYVSQEPVLILGTIRENILFGNKDATDEEIKQVIKEAKADFIYDMENKLDTYIGSAAVLNLSGGQKQRIAIARALIKKPKILILDEATSALDPKSEKEVQAAIDNISTLEKKLTIIMIAHRLQTIQSAQNLLYIESKESVIPGAKGSQEYENIMNKLAETYSHQASEEITEKEEINQQQTELQAKRLEQNALLFQRSETTNNDMDKIMLTERGLLKPQQKSSEDAPYEAQISMAKIMKYYSPKWMAFCGLLISIINGWAFPIYGLLFANILFVMLTPQLPTFGSDRDFYCGMFLLEALLMGLVAFLQKYIFSYVGENLIFTFRNKLFESILYKQISWFDAKDKAPGILGSILSEDIGQLGGLTTENIAMLAEAGLALTLGIIFSFVYTWKMALITMAVSPLILVGAVMMTKLQWAKGFKNKVLDEEDPYQKSNALLSDIIMNYRTVISFGEKNVDFLMKQYDNLLAIPNQQGIRQAHWSGFFFGYSQAIRFFFIAFVFYIASLFIFKQGDNPKDTYIGVYILFVSALGSGIAISSAPSIGKAKEAGKRIFAIIEQKTKIDARDTEGLTEIPHGRIEFVRVNFKYPTRSQMILNNFKMKIPATKKIALVGHSGCGKSTIANLLLRMYEYIDGQILIDGKDLREYNVKALRKQIGIVMQEPLLFNMTIKENILYGNDEADDMKVRQVAEMANALQFIESNIEDLDKEEVAREIERVFRTKISQISEDYPSMQDLIEEFDNKNLSIEEIRLIEEILQKADMNLKQKIDSCIEQFIQCVKLNSQRKGIRWDDIVIKFEWQFEMTLIKDFLNNQDIKDSLKDLIIECLMKHQCQSDLKTVKNFVKEISIIERDADIIPILLQKIEESEERIKHAHLERIKELGYQLVQDGHFKLHEGFNKPCGLKGSKLSGGQKQRIAIARALIKDPKILILDEATSALDEKSQEIVQQALDRAMEGRTSIVIAHRLSTIRNCEWLFVIHKGQVVEQGTFDKLAADKDSYFYKLKSGMEM